MSAPAPGSFNVSLAIREHVPSELNAKREARAELVGRLQVITREIAELELWELIGAKP